MLILLFLILFLVIGMLIWIRIILLFCFACLLLFRFYVMIRDLHLGWHEALLRVCVYWQVLHLVCLIEWVVLLCNHELLVCLLEWVIVIALVLVLVLILHLLSVRIGLLLFLLPIGRLIIFVMCRVVVWLCLFCILILILFRNFLGLDIRDKIGTRLMFLHYEIWRDLLMLRLWLKLFSFILHLYRLLRFLLNLFFGNSILLGYQRGLHLGLLNLSWWLLSDFCCRRCRLPELIGCAHIHAFELFLLWYALLWLLKEILHQLRRASWFGLKTLSVYIINHFI